MPITRDRLMELVHYDPASGVFTSKVDRKRVRVDDILGYVNAKGYVCMMIESKAYTCHRLAWLYVHGYFPVQLDHINRIKTDNRLINLRECSRSENGLNRGTPCNNTSGKKGVSWVKNSKKWKAALTYVLDGVKIRLISHHETFEEACQARDEFERELNSEFLRHD